MTFIIGVGTSNEKSYLWRSANLPYGDLTHTDEG